MHSVLLLCCAPGSHSNLQSGLMLNYQNSLLTWASGSENETQSLIEHHVKPY